MKISSSNSFPICNLIYSYRLRLVYLLITFLLSSFVFSVNAAELNVDDYDAKVTVGESGLRVRVAPQTGSQIGSLFNGQTVRVTHHVVDLSGNWRKIAWSSGRVAYVSGDYLTKLDNNSSSTPTSSSTSGCSQQLPTEYLEDHYVGTATATYKMREQPHTNCPHTEGRLLAKGQQAKIVAKDGNWRYAENLSTGLSGWVHANAFKSRSSNTKTRRSSRSQARTLDYPDFEPGLGKPTIQERFPSFEPGYDSEPSIQSRFPSFDPSLGKPTIQERFPEFEPGYGSSDNNITSAAAEMGITIELPMVGTQVDRDALTAQIITDIDDAEEVWFYYQALVDKPQPLQAVNQQAVTAELYWTPRAWAYQEAEGQEQLGCIGWHACVAAWEHIRESDYRNLNDEERAIVVAETKEIAATYCLDTNCAQKFFRDLIWVDLQVALADGLVPSGRVNLRPKVRPNVNIGVDAPRTSIDDNNAASRVKWVDENASMGVEAGRYNDSAPGARSNVETRSGQAPAIDRTLPDGTKRPVRFDGLDGNVLIDRKLSVMTRPKVKNQAMRQSQALKENGLTGRWEVPTETQARRAKKMFTELGIDNIEVKVVPES